MLQYFHCFPWLKIFLIENFYLGSLFGCIMWYNLLVYINQIFSRSWQTCLYLNGKAIAALTLHEQILQVKMRLSLIASSNIRLREYHILAIQSSLRKHSLSYKEWWIMSILGSLYCKLLFASWGSNYKTMRRTHDMWSKYRRKKRRIFYWLW